MLSLKSLIFFSIHSSSQGAITPSRWACMHLQCLVEYSLCSQWRELRLKMEADTASFGTPEFWMDRAVDWGAHFKNADFSLSYLWPPPYASFYFLQKKNQKKPNTKNGIINLNLAPADLFFLVTLLGILVVQKHQLTDWHLFRRTFTAYT